MVSVEINQSQVCEDQRAGATCHSFNKWLSGYIFGMDMNTKINEPDRPLRPALLQGWKRKCPACGNGPLLQGFLTVRDECAVCGEELFHQRADDGPSWATILITGHLLAPSMLFVFTAFRPEPWVMATGFSIFFVLLTMFLLPRIKGMFVALQWAKRMHGFGGLSDVLDKPIEP